MAHDEFAPPTKEQERVGRLLYDGNRADVLPSNAKGDLYTHCPAVEVIKQRGADLFVQAGVGSAGQDRLGQKYQQIERTTGLPGLLVASIAGGEIDNMLAAARGGSDPEREEIALAERIAAANAELREEFVLRYGAKEGEDLLARTARYVRSHPQLAQTLRQRGLGSRRDIVEGIAAHVFSTGWRG